MSEAKLKIKELAAELGLQPKEVLNVARELGISAKQSTASLSQEDAAKVRDYFANAQQNEVTRHKSESGVIVRRRNRAPEEAAPAAAPASDEGLTAAEAAAEKTPPAETVAPAAESRSAEAAPAADPAPEGEKAAPAARVVAPARVISRPQEAPVEAAAPAQAAEAPQAEPPAGEAPEAAAPAPENAPASQTESENAEKEKARPARHARPDASAIPEGSSAPTLPPRAPEPREKAEADDSSAATSAEVATTQRARVIAPASPQVRVISRPTPGSASARDGSGRDERPARRDNRSGDSRDGRGDNRDRGGQRPGGRAPFGGDNRGPRPGASSGGYAAPAQPTPLDSRDGQSKKKRLKGRRTVEFQQGDFGHQDEDDAPRMNRGKSRRKPGKAVPAAQQATQPLKAAKRKIRVDEAIVVADMAHQMGLKSSEIIKVLFNLGVMATINKALDIDTATLVAAEFGYEVEKTGFSESDYLLPTEPDKPEDLKPRPPVVTIMGHVDHGKTSLLDAIRKSNVTSGEAGGITQHIGAYHVKTKRGEIVFLDTPGHEAFTAMRARGAQVTDLVILVVAADDGVMEQTREAINHAKAANVPIMVAVNKMDKPGADPDRVLRELSELGLQPEDWGGDTIVAKVSAKTREGLDDLLEMVALQAEILELKANPNKPAHGRIVEAKLDKGRGPVATVLIQEGTLRQGDTFVCGQFSGRVRALLSDQGKKVKEAGPSIPVEVQGFDGVPEAGEEFFSVADEKLARRIADARAIKQREKDLAKESRVTLETFLSRRASDQEALTLNLVLKADVQGTLEAITEALNKQSTDKVRISIVHGGTGAITESDILLASASQAIIIGFNVRPTAKIKDVAERENVDIRFYDIIYKLVDDIKSAMAGLLAPVQREVYLGQAEVRKTISVPKVGIIAGSYVADGKIARNAGVRLLRDGVVVYTGKISSLKRFKDDAREVVKGNECGVGLENFNDIKIGDIIEAFETVEEAATL